MAGPRRGRRGERQGNGHVKGARILIVEARFYDDIADALLAGAIKALKEARAEFDCISVPGVARNPDRHCDRARCRTAPRAPMTASSRSAA